jgi:hypothetical protein
MTQLSARALYALARRKVLAIDPAVSIAVKRNVHEFVIDAPAARFARAFHDVMSEADATFGRLEVRRDPARAGKPFVVGERFQGCISLGLSFPRVRRLADRIGLGGLLTRIEDEMLSDYSEITELEESSDSFRAAYVYLSGCPMAGESRFEVTPLRDRCRLVVEFSYQEISSVAILVVHRLGALLHDRVVIEQIERAAKRAGGKVVSSTMEGLASSDEREGR